MLPRYHIDKVLKSSLVPQLYCGMHIILLYLTIYTPKYNLGARGNWIVEFIRHNKDSCYLSA